MIGLTANDFYKGQRLYCEPNFSSVSNQPGKILITEVVNGRISVEVIGGLEGAVKTYGKSFTFDVGSNFSRWLSEINEDIDPSKFAICFEQAIGLNKGKEESNT